MRAGRAAGGRTTDYLSRTALMWPAARGEDAGSCGNHPGATDSLTGTSRSWQTPAADSFRCRGGARKEEMGLDQQARFWPTPTVPSRGPETRTSKAARGSGGIDLQTRVRAWPTPTARDEKGANGAHHTARALAAGTRAHLDQLPNFVAHCFRRGPTSSNTGPKSSPRAEATSPAPRLNPRFVAWLMGWPPIDATGFGFSATAWWTSRARMRSALCSLTCENAGEND